MSTAFKIVTAADWTLIRRTGAYAGSPVDRRDGYIHLSTADQLAETAARHYAGQDALMLLEVDLDPHGPAVVWEPSRGGALFPHIYGELRGDSVRGARPFSVSADGVMRFGDAA